MVDWSKVPDLGAVALLTAAFAAVAQRSRNSASSLWLIGWIMIAAHFAAQIFASVDGFGGTFASFVGLAALAWAGTLFSWAAVPFHQLTSSKRLLAAYLGTNTLYLAVLLMAPQFHWAVVAAALLYCVAPLSLGLSGVAQTTHPLRWITIFLYSALSAFLLAVQNRPGTGSDLALNAVFFTVYLSCCIHFLYVYRRLATGVFITSAGFLAWAAVFLIAPLQNAYLPSIHIESEVWNLPKYVVAVGMMLLLLEEQIEHNKYLALHDELTGLPNRRLFQDRLVSALERARRSRQHTALLLIDLDHFKQVNDSVGHHIGDLALQRAAQVFLDRVRRSDTVARTGGDEFSVILEEPVTRKDAEHVGAELIELLRQPMHLQNHTVKIGASIGIAMFPQDAQTDEALRIAADVRMYARKHERRNAVEILPHIPREHQPAYVIAQDEVN